MSSGKLVYVVGASGSGKDSVLAYARAGLVDHSRVVFLHRYITRPHDAGGENHVALSEPEFEARQAQNQFSMSWQAHGLKYGIGCELDQFLEAGSTVVLNGSREYLQDIPAQYSPHLRVVLIEAPDDVIHARLLARGRESQSETQARIARSKGIALPDQLTIHHINNSGEVSVAGEALLELLANTR